FTSPLSIDPQRFSPPRFKAFPANLGFLHWDTPIPANPTCADSFYLALKYGQPLRSGDVLHVSPEVLNCLYLRPSSHKLCIGCLLRLVEDAPSAHVTATLKHRARFGHCLSKDLQRCHYGSPIVAPAFRNASKSRRRMRTSLPDGLHALRRPA